MRGIRVIGRPRHAVGSGAQLEVEARSWWHGGDPVQLHVRERDRAPVDGRGGTCPHSRSPKALPRSGATRYLRRRPVGTPLRRRPVRRAGAATSARCRAGAAIARRPDRHSGATVGKVVRAEISHRQDLSTKLRRLSRSVRTTFSAKTEAPRNAAHCHRLPAEICDSIQRRNRFGTTGGSRRRTLASLTFRVAIAATVAGHSRSEGRPEGRLPVHPHVRYCGFVDRQPLSAPRAKRKSLK